MTAMTTTTTKRGPEVGRRVEVSPDPQPTDGCAVVEQAVSLLHTVKFSTDFAGFAEGDLAAVFVDPEWDRASQRITAAFALFSLRQHAVDWDKLIIVVRGEESGGDEGFAFPDPTGHAEIHDLRPGKYRIEASLGYGRSETPILQSRHRDRLQCNDLRADGSDAALPIQQSHVIESKDKKVRATIRQSPSGDTVAAFETNDPTLANATIRFAFVPQSGRSRFSDQVTLSAHKAQPGLWEGRWIGAIVVEEPCELVFEVRTARSEAT